MNSSMQKMRIDSKILKLWINVLSHIILQRTNISIFLNV